MAKKKSLSPQEKLLHSLKKMPNPLVDKKHGILICLENDRVRSNETRYEHIIVKRHGLYSRDIKRISQEINNSILVKEKDRKDTFDLFIKRDNFSNRYIKVSLEFDYETSNKAYIKTIFIVRSLK